MLCSRCGAANAETARFCASCGERLTEACPHCNADGKPGARFCSSCGQAIARGLDGKPARDAAAVDAARPSERRLVSVLFVDLEDFTALAESLDPEDVRNLQARYFEVARSVIAHHGGTIEKFIGDAVMAVWGAPTAHEDDGERAVRAALELVAAIGRLRGASSDTRLAARAAVTTGEAAVTLGVQGEGIVAGDLVNTAARLQSVAPSGGVLVDDTTHRMVRNVIEFASAGVATLKGKQRTLVTWRATGIAEGRLRGRGAGHIGLFVGRDRELAELMDLFERVVTSRRSRLVSVLGIAGIGKSRLTWEFERRLDALTQPLALHVGRAPSYGEGITFAPLAEMVRRRARISEGTETEVARRQLATTLVELFPDEVERRWIEPRLATLLDPVSDAGFDRDELFAAWRRFFERVSEWAPALLIFEDVQWADPALLDFIDHLATWSRSYPILVVTLARPELLDRRPTWGAGHHSFTALRLEPLGRRQMSELLLGLAPSLPPEILRRIVEGAGGVPLYAVEVLRMLADRGQARPQDGGFEWLPGIGDLEIPETLHSLVSARIDALPAPERSALLSASVLGRRFHPDAVAAVARLEPHDARERIAALVRRELVTVDDEPRSPGRGQLSFVQEVVRDVAYRTVSRRERRRLHLAAADYLAGLTDAELIEAVAEHLEEAHAAAPDHADASGVAVRAVDTLRLAAARALSLGAPARALTHLQRALELVEPDDMRATLWSEAAGAARAAASFDLAETLLRQVIAWRLGRGDRDAVSRARAQLASLLLATERHESALADLEAALQGIGNIASDPSSVELGGQLARARVLVGDDEQALAWADRTLAAAEQLGQESIALDALITRGTASIRLGDDVRGLADLGRAVSEADRLGLVAGQLRARNNLAWLVAQDDPRSAMETARAGLELATRMGVDDMALQLGVVVCAIAIDTGEWAAALHVLDDARNRPQAPAHRLQFFESENIIRALRGESRADELLAALGPLAPDTDPQIRAGIDHAMAWSALLDGRLEDAWRRACAAADRSLGLEQHDAVVLAGRAALWLSDGLRLDACISRLEQAGIHGRAVAAAAQTLVAGAAALEKRADARPLYAGAVAAWRTLRLPLPLALCLAERRRFPSISDVSDGEEAAAILAELGASGLLRAVQRMPLP